MSHPSLLSTAKVDNRKWTIAILYFLFSPFAVSAKPHAAERNELPAPDSVQAVVLPKTITLSWQWPRPETLPIFKEFGFEIKRNDHPSSAFKEDGPASTKIGSRGGKTFLVPGTTYADDKLLPGTYSYVIRVRGVAKEKGKNVTYVSDWSEPAGGTIKLACTVPPSITLSVEQTQKAYASVSSLRFHLKGHAATEGACTLGRASYHLDTGTGIAHDGPLAVDSKGRFDTYVNAFGPDDEIPSGRVSFAISASAHNEAGPSTSDVYTVDVELQNRFAPH